MKETHTIENRPGQLVRIKFLGQELLLETLTI